MYFLYILKSLSKERFYIGICANTEVRLIRHNRGSTKSTKPYRPWKIIYIETYNTKQEAYKREYYLKHPS